MNDHRTVPLSRAAWRLLWVSRPRFWLYLAGPTLVGLVYAVDSLDALLTPLSMGLFVYFLVPANVLLYGVNDVFDAPIDRTNPKKSDRELRYEGGPLTPLAVVFCLLLAVPLAVVLRPLAIAWLLVFFILALAYSAPPARLKTRPPIDSLSNGLYIVPGVVAYVAIAGGHPPLLIVLGGWVWAMAMHTFSAIPDIEPDRRAGIQTLATRLGNEGALAYCGLCWAAAAVCFGVIDLRAGLLLGVYPLLAVGVGVANVSIDRAYWWFPAINATVGAIITIAGLWGLAHA